MQYLALEVSADYYTLYDHQEIFVWSNRSLELLINFLIGNLVFDDMCSVLQWSAFFFGHIFISILTITNQHKTNVRLISLGERGRGGGVRPTLQLTQN